MYKRQEYIYREGGDPSVKKPIIVTEICSIETAVTEVERQLLEKARFRFRTTTKMAEALGAVSYTHLDVYKRQRLF